MINRDDMQHIAMLMLEMQINLGRAVRENDRLNAELAKKGGNEVPIVPPEKKEE